MMPPRTTQQRAVTHLRSAMPGALAGRVRSAQQVRPRPPLVRVVAAPAAVNEWVQPADVVVTEAQGERNFYLEALGVTVNVPAQGAVVTSGGGAVAYEASSSSDTQYNVSHFASLLYVDLSYTLGDGAEDEMPPVGPSDAEVTAAGATGWEAEAPAGVMADVVTATVTANFVSLEHLDDNSGKTDLGDLETTNVDIRALGASDWDPALLVFDGDEGPDLPSASWLSARPLAATLPLTHGGTVRTIDSTGFGLTNNRASGGDSDPRAVSLGIFSRSSDFIDGAQAAFAAYLDALPGLPYNDPGRTSFGNGVHNKLAFVSLALTVTFTYTPPRWRFTYA